MEVDSFLKPILLILFLFFSALFSGAEVALFSLEKRKLNEDKVSNKLIFSYIKNLLNTPKRLLVTILLGNTIFNVGASIIAVSLALKIARDFGYREDIALVVQIIVLTVLILIFGEITPKVWASKYPLLFSKIVAVPLYWISVIVYPVSQTLTDLIKLLTRKIKSNKTKTALHSTELTELADLGIAKGTIEEEEHELIHGFVSFKTITSREVMTPRVDITAAPLDIPFEELLQLILESGHSRIPLYESSLDNITGIVYAKDLLEYIGDPELQSSLSLRKIARKTIFVPESKLINELMQDFREQNLHLGIVVDEYGGTSGLISLEDILEEIVGEIRDENDLEENEIQQINETSYIVLGKVPIDDLNELLNENFDSDEDDFDTVGGFVLNHIGSIPAQDYSFDYNGFNFTIKEVENNRITKVLIKIIKEESGNDQEGMLLNS